MHMYCTYIHVLIVEQHIHKMREFPCVEYKINVDKLAKSMIFLQHTFFSRSILL